MKQKKKKAVPFPAKIIPTTFDDRTVDRGLFKKPPLTTWMMGAGLGPFPGFVSEQGDPGTVIYAGKEMEDYLHSLKLLVEEIGEDELVYQEAKVKVEEAEEKYARKKKAIGPLKEIRNKLVSAREFQLSIQRAEKAKRAEEHEQSIMKADNSVWFMAYAINVEFKNPLWQGARILEVKEYLISPDDRYYFLKVEKERLTESQQEEEEVTEGVVARVTLVGAQDELMVGKEKKQQFRKGAFGEDFYLSPQTIEQLQTVAVVSMKPILPAQTAGITIWVREGVPST